MRKLRILALHGYHGTGAILHSQLRALADELRPLADFVYADAPSLAAGDHGWWHAVAADDAAAGPGVGVSRRHYRGWDKTRAWIEALCARERFDGVLGFSQGAALAALLAGLCAVEGQLGFDFAVVVSGFSSSDARHQPLYDALPASAMPSLHIIGKSDGVVPPAQSHALARRFAGATVLEHDGGHVIAATPAIRRGVSDFLRARASEPPRSRHAGRGGPTATQGPPASRRPLALALWPGREHPLMRVVFPARESTTPRPALVVLRGGAYFRSDGTGDGTAEWAAAHGMVGVEVEYRTRSSGDAFPANYADAARAMRLTRRHAREWNVDAARVGLIGYSAGGHLASLVSTQPNLPVPEDELAAQFSARPDLVVLAYPVVSFVEQFTPGAFVSSAESFFGHGDLSAAQRRQFSNELHVDAGHPPVFIWTTADDALVPYTHSKLFAEACRRAQVPVTFMLFPHGPHGLGLALDRGGDVGTWTTQLLAWLTERWGPLGQ